MNPLNAIHQHAVIFQTPGINREIRANRVAAIKTIIDNSEQGENVNENLANQFIDARPWFLRELLSFSTDTLVSPDAWCGFAHFLNSLMDKGVVIRHTMFDGADLEKWRNIMKNYIINHAPAFNTSTNEQKRKIMLLWEVYCDIFDEDEEVRMLFP